MHILILAGGSGTRLWPLSRQDFPKQFLHFGDQQSLLQKSVGRFLHSPLAETVSISTNAQCAPLVKQQLEKIDPDHQVHIIVEPARRNTAPAIAYAIKYLTENLGVEKDAPVLVIPSDHLIEPQSIFSHYLEEIKPLLQKDRLVLFGIRPTRPETGYGYIQIGEKYNLLTHEVKRFVEKPDRKLAEIYLASGDYYWNSGMFGFSIRLFWQQIALHAPEIARLMKGASFEQMPDISFDFAVLEKCQNILVCPLPVSWSDVGSWDSVYDVMAKDQNQNVKFGNVVDIETKNSLIIGGKRLISTIGLEDLIIIETDDATFISKKGESQKVKNIVQELIKIGRKEGSTHTTQRFSWGTIHTLDETQQYTLQKVTIDPGQSWEFKPPRPGRLIPLERTFLIEINGQSLDLFDSYTIQTEQSLKISNPFDTPLNLIYLNQM